LTDLIVDASVVAKWLVDEPGSTEARQLISPDVYLRAPDLLLPEVINTLCKKHLRGDLTAGKATECLNTLLQDHIDVTVHLLPARILGKRALEIAKVTGRSTYDCLYLAAAVQAGCGFVTADARFVRSVKDPALRRHMIELASSNLKRTI
jgi:predicted nucleic acid-binding protein